MHLIFEFLEIVFWIICNIILQVHSDNVMMKLISWSADDIDGHLFSQDATATIIGCSRKCQTNQSCQAIFYNESNQSCFTFENDGVGGITLQDNEIGSLYHKKKECYYSDYEYIWQLDLCLFFNTTTANWTESQTNCENQNGNLIIVHNHRKEEVVMPLLREKSDFHSVKSWWLGASDREDEGQFKWVDGSSLTYTNWGASQPDNLGVGEADCIRNVMDKNAKWFDRNCDDKLASICENKIFL